MDLLKTQKGGTGLIHNGFKHVVNRKTTSKTFWRCSDRKCSGRVTTEGTTVKITANHSHPANEAKLEAEKLPSRLFIANFMVFQNLKLLAHLSQRLTWLAYSIPIELRSVRLSMKIAALT